MVVEFKSTDVLSLTFAALPPPYRSVIVESPATTLVELTSASFPPP